VENETLAGIYGSMIFNDSVMRERLPKAIYNAWQSAVLNHETLSRSTADVIANAMKDWAISKGATHYSHWFIPMTGKTAEKHDSFLSQTSDGRVIMEFSGKNLVKGEPDASSFPSGGLRATFEARGYTAWDCTSPAFVRNKILYIPTLFCSYTGESLDKKTPLLRSMDALSASAVRLMRLMGHSDVKNVNPFVGSEQEYFIITKEDYDKRPDLIFTGRTLIGVPAVKGQEMDDHYFGSINARVTDFMQALNRKFCELGISAKTEHNEAAPAQHEFAPIFSIANIATDQNHLVMEIMQQVALEKGLVCLLHEKPFDGINGSGKHNNWSIVSDNGVNLLEPGREPAENIEFALVMSGIIRAVDKYADLLRFATASYGNDLRLGSHEAPPAIISVYLGETITNALYDACSSERHNRARVKFDTGVASIPRFTKDSEDRNRTSPFAFTGNKFEFRMVGSSQSVADANIILNTIAADSFDYISDKLEGGRTPQEVISEILTNHSRIIFNGNNYSEEWREEASRRGLHNIADSVDAVASLLDEKNMLLFEKFNVFSNAELEARYEIMLEAYIKTANVEAKCLYSMVKNSIYGALMKNIAEYCNTANGVSNVGISIIGSRLEERINTMYNLSEELIDLADELTVALDVSRTISDSFEKACYFRDNILNIMERTRRVCDDIEGNMDDEFYPFPKYTDILFDVR